VCRRLKAREETRHIPIILISAFADVKEWVDGLELGAADYITKPFQTEELLTRVKTHLGLSRANVSLSQQAAALRQTSEELQSEIVGRQRVEDELRQSLVLAERSRRAMLSALEDQKRVEQALQKSETMLRAILDATPFPVALVDNQDNNIEFWSQSALTVFGHTATTAPEWYQIAYPDPDYRREVIEKWKPALEKARQSSQAVNTGEYRVTCRDGSVRICELYAAFLADKLIVTFNDITERRHAEELLRARMRLMEFAAAHSLEDTLQKTLDEVSKIVNSPIGFYHFVEPNQKTLALQAWSTRTVQEFCTAQGQGMHYSVDVAGVWVDCVHQRRPVIHNDYASLPHRKGLPEGHAPVLRELVVPILRDDRVVAILGVGNKPTDYDEKDVELVAHFADVAWEIAERKRAEEALRRKNQYFAALQETTLELLSQRDLDILLENTVKRAGALMDTPAGFLDLVDPATQQLQPRVGIGALKESLRHPVQPGEGLAGIVWQTGKPLVIEDYDHWTGRVGDFSHGTLGAIIGVPLLSGEQVLGVLGLAYELGVPHTFDAEAVEMLTQFARLTMLAIENARLFSVAQQELAERQRARVALQEYSERLVVMVDERTRELRDAQERLLRQERLTMLGQIAGGIGHELRGPLGSIKNAVYLLRQTVSAPDGDTREMLDLLNRQVEASNRIITSLLSFARPQPPARRAADVRAVLDAALAQAALPDNIVVQREFEAGLPELNADPDQLQIVFGNLIRNAAQAMWEGGRLTIAARLISDFKFQISDLPTASQAEIANLKSEIINHKSAIGESAIQICVSDTGGGIAPEAMEKLFQPTFTTKSRGIGLGLALCKLIVEAHGGAIAVESTAGKGTTFVIALPLALLPRGF
jgi:PAS domain S-box-containing protein